MILTAMICRPTIRKKDHSIFLIITLSIFLSVGANTQDIVIPLWSEGIPCENQLTEEIEDKGGELKRLFSKIHTPDIAVYKPDNPNGTAVLICPGGGYTVLAYDWEGVYFARWFNKMGITVVVLKNRLPHWETDECRSVVALLDAKRAMRLVRMHAEDWGLDTKKIGVMGFSAGGHLASTLSTQFDLGDLHDVESIEYYSSRPDFSILVYPVISMDTSFTHIGSRNNLIGEYPSEALRLQYSSELQVTSETPPTLLIHASDDMAVPVENSIRYYQSLIEHQVPASLLIYESGGHGFSMANDKSGAVAGWLEDCKSWMIEAGLLENH